MLVSVQDDNVALILQFVLCYLLVVFWLLLTARLVIEIVRSFARSWTPTRSRAVALEVIYLATGPPVRLLRRLIPTVRIAGVGLDLSIMIVFVVVYIAMSIAHPSTV